MTSHHRLSSIGPRVMVTGIEFGSVLGAAFGALGAVLIYIVVRMSRGK